MGRPLEHMELTMPTTDRVLITHPDGRRFSVTKAAHNRLYAKDGFVIGEPEQPTDFVARVPKAPTRAGSRRKTVKPAARPGRVRADATQPAPARGAETTADGAAGMERG